MWTFLWWITNTYVFYWLILLRFYREKKGFGKFCWQRSIPFHRKKWRWGFSPRPLYLGDGLGSHSPPVLHYCIRDMAVSRRWRTTKDDRSRFLTWGTDIKFGLCFIWEPKLVSWCLMTTVVVTDFCNGTLYLPLHIYLKRGQKNGTEICRTRTTPERRLCCS